MNLIFLLAALQAGSGISLIEDGKVPVTVAVVETGAPGAESPVILRGGKAGDVIIIGEGTSSYQFATAVRAFQDSYRIHGATPMMLRVPVETLRESRRGGVHAAWKSKAQDVVEGKATEVVPGVGVARTFLIWVVVEEPGGD